MLVVGVTTEIRASVKEVWDVLSDIADFDTWNPLIRRVDGQLQVGNTVTIYVALDTREQPIDVVVSRMVPKKELGWQFVDRYRWLYCGEHVFKLADAGGDMIRLVDSEYFWGLLVPFRRLVLKKRITASMTLMGQALKERVEGRGRSIVSNGAPSSKDPEPR